MQATTVAPQGASPAPNAPVTAPSATTGVPQTAAELRARRSEMSSQLSNVEDRRSRLVDELQRAPAEARIGLQERIRQLDQRILSIEADLQETGRLLTLTPGGPRGTTVVPGGAGFPFPGGPSVPDLTGFFVMLLLLPLSIAVARRVWKRTTGAIAPVRESRESAERMLRLEQAVDAIAVEIERVGEAQRYQARILTEAQLMPALGAGQRPAEPILVPEPERARQEAPRP